MYAFATASQSLIDSPKAFNLDAVNLHAICATVLLSLLACGTPATEAQNVQGEATPLVHTVDVPDAEIVVGAERWPVVLAALAGKRVGAVVNHTSQSGDHHLVDRLLQSEVEVLKVFAPEHGFRGIASDGEKVADATDPSTGLPILSLYGKSKRPSKEMLEGLDVVVFDIQDVGTRFYTYISTMHYVMDAASEYGLEVVVLDRPNPLGAMVDGPVLDTAYRSFIGMHEIPTVHGLTVGELAYMINEEGWLPNARKAKLTVVPVSGYAVGDEYVLPIRPSPNLPNQASIYLYPTLCHFEGTVASIGRGTDFPFQVVGHPQYPDSSFAFTPAARSGAAYAKLKGKRCYGLDLRGSEAATKFTGIDYEMLASFAEALPDGVELVDRTGHFDLIAGGDGLRTALSEGKVSAFAKTYQADLDEYLEMRAPYLMYRRLEAE